MRRRSLLNVTLAGLVALPWMGAAAMAQSNVAKDDKTGTATQSRVLEITDVAGRVHKITRKITQAEREAAAVRLKGKLRGQPPGRVAGALPGGAPYMVGANNQLIPDYSGATANWAYSPIPLGTCSLTGEQCSPGSCPDPPAGNLCANVTGGLRKFVDPLPGLYISGSPPPAAGAKYIPVAQPQAWPVGCTPAVNCDAVDYYEIEVGEYESWTFHSDMPTPTKLRGYRQTNATDPLVGVFSYLGPVIVAQRGRPVRIKFTNNLPAGAGGNLYIPVDTSITGSGAGPAVPDGVRDPAAGFHSDVFCMPDPATGIIPAGCYTQNRATLHLHGGVTPWISDGTTHQWITPAADTTQYPKGVSVYNVPDMPNPGWPPSSGPGVAQPGVGSNAVDPGAGVQTFFWTNDQSARLMFYHDHASGITRLNVYVGEAAGYLIRDSHEASLEAGGFIPGLLDNVPLVIQEKTFVDSRTIGTTDPTWNWGTAATTTPVPVVGGTFNQRDAKTGDLWWPHVYMPAQNPSDISGYNAMGRWNYGPWFFPPTPIPYPPLLNPYAQPDCQTTPPGPGCTMPWQPYEIPGTPNPSWGAEAFLDTLVINGTAYPTLTVQPRTYRFRILNAGGDRFVNLQLFLAADKDSPTTEGSTGAVMCDGTTGVPVERCTEVKMVPAVTTPGFPPMWPRDGREGGVPDPATMGPSFFAIGTEGGFLAMPVELAPQPVVWNRDPLTFNFGNVSDFSLLLAPAERADAIVDFSTHAGKTFILYNDAPAAFPALDPRNDYYTGNPDLRDTGGTYSTVPGYGPNIRTLMQINVAAATPGGGFNMGALEAEFTTTDPANADTWGVFKASQDEIMVGQGAIEPGYTAYNRAYGKAFPSTFPWWGLGTIYTHDVKFETVAGSRVTVAAQPKAIHDEMGATFDDYGRMRASLGVQLPNPTPPFAAFVMQGYDDPATELVRLVATPLGDPTADGSQVWRVNHNGVDTHPVHFHLFHVQVVNRVGWDGAYRLPHPTELGLKDTVRISPLEDTYVALRPIAPKPDSLPFKVPNSFRPLAPSHPIGSTLGFTNRDPLGNPIVPGLANQEANFGWEYVWHCHILSHEENDMMRAIVFGVTPETPTALPPTTTQLPLSVTLNWTDTSLIANGYRIQRDTDVNFPAPVNLPAGATPVCANATLGCPRTFTDTDPTLAVLTTYYYRVFSTNTVGSGVPNYPSLTVDSAPLVMTVQTPAGALPPAAPTNLIASISAANPDTATLAWQYTPGTFPAHTFRIERRNGAGPWAAVGTVPGPVATTFTQAPLTRDVTYTYRVFAVNVVGDSAPSNEWAILDARPARPDGLIATRNNGGTGALLTWDDNSNSEQGFQVQRATNNSYTQNAFIYPMTAPGATTQFSLQVDGLTAGQRYFLRVRAVNAIGASQWSPTFTLN